MTKLYCVLFVASLSACSMLSPKPPATPDLSQQQAQNNKAQLETNIDSFQRNYEQMWSQLENSMAKVEGYFQSLPPKAKNDPQFALLDKQYREAQAASNALPERKDELLAWADQVRDAPSTADVQTFARKSNSINQDMAALMTQLGRLQQELFGLKARAR
ncbi:MAG: hypothetical protein D6689_18470 [Deltaproteobacteria bacterium]|nr:MAG: hypothetical protein D6689_18470 [Deltaproteobacteria bacterium]